MSGLINEVIADKADEEGSNYLQQQWKAAGCHVTLRYVTFKPDKRREVGSKINPVDIKSP